MTSYWNGNGELQKEYDTMFAAVYDGTFSFTKASRASFHSYYRYYNDGDIPGWARGKWNLTRYGRFGLKLNDAGEAELERRATEIVSKEWVRFCKKH